MEINLTFCIQILNFIIFCKIVSRYFLRPFVDFIQAKVKFRNKMRDEFSRKEVLLAGLVHQKTEFGQQFKKILKDRYPLPQKKEQQIPVEVELASLDKKESGVVKDRLVQEIVQKVKHAY